MVRSGSGSPSSSSSSSSSSHHRRAHSPATERLRQFLPWDSSSRDRTTHQSTNQNQTPSPTSQSSASRAATALAVLLGVAQQVVTHTTSPHHSVHSEYNMPASPNTNGSRQRQDEASPLLDANGASQPPLTRRTDSGGIVHGKEPDTRSKKIVWTALTVLFVAALVFFLGFIHMLSDKLAPWVGLLPKDPHKAALMIMKQAPVIDGHVDLPILIREVFANNLSAVDLEQPTPRHVDIPRLRKGHTGGFFWSAYVGCAKPGEEGKDFLDATWIVRDTLEQIDVAHGLIAKYPDTFQPATTSEEVEAAISGGKIASLIGIEGAHQLGNSIAVLRTYHALGVRYITLTHTCHNAFADSCGYAPGIIPLHHGLSSLGKRLIDEMNRIGVLVDLSHTSDATASQAIQYSKAPVIWSHSSARALHNHVRNVPDEILGLIGREEWKNDAVVMVNFAPHFVADDGEATVQAVADHVEHIAQVAGKEHVGIGSDFDGITSTPEGLEDVSKYPALIAELISRGWDKYEIAGLTGGNLLRIMKGAERVAKELQTAGTPPVYDIYHKRSDLPQRAADDL
ncbi:hypothetical protein D9756_007481 [Leucocoprinus leucothites]|uniref:Dipeptidase n=1 Tax=Leucocoprinus leucothites TaxID=201217 RepID=A0A8H5D2E0_9AGAR|nr:hypothetical protein D9756_007481 [Leucoagaricus leucothites]